MYLVKANCGTDKEIERILYNYISIFECFFDSFKRNMNYPVLTWASFDYNFLETFFFIF